MGFSTTNNPSVMKAPLSTSESTVVPLSPKVVNTVKAIEKVPDTQIALLLLCQVNNSSLTYTLRTSHSLSTKDAVAGLTRQVHKCLASILRCSAEDILKVADRIVMPLGPGLGFTELESLALSAFQASLLQATRLLNSLDQDRFPIPQHDKLSHSQYKRTVDAHTPRCTSLTVTPLSSSSTPSLNSSLSRGSRLSMTD